MVKNTTAESTAVSKYSKEQLISSERYVKRRDLLGALLKDGKDYSVEEVDTLLENYMKGKVK